MIQGESNLKFMWFILAQNDDIPSLSTVKNFKLPGLLPPIRVIFCSRFVIVVVILNSLYSK